ncbi:MAG: Hsp20/alpha crystallin family protein [Gammaproteobacteria bacterium]|nr:Hsp20/alpha crystallin family protein [Gammaproteobacteria bacterium]MBV8404637.1 Hsp20/alpha crystallin family protein [Gammaproteobacteria bacterium]
MNLMRWEPFEAVDMMFNRLPFFSFGRQRLGSSEYFDWSPTADISETDTEYLIRAALPAVKKEDVKVTYEDGVLTLSGERRQEALQKDEKFHKIESFYGNFLRSFALPDAIDEQSIRAETRDGVLTIHVPKAKSEAKKLTTIKVQ